MKKVLILGGTGFIGFNIAQFLALNRECELTIVDDFSRGANDSEFDSFSTRYNIRLIAADLSNPAAFKSLAINYYDDVYVLASVVGVNRCIEEPEEVIRINTAIISNTTEWLRIARPKRVLFTSSSEIYAATNNIFNYTIPTPETVPICIEDTRQPRFTYAITKILGEAAFFSYGKKLGIHTTVVRYHNIYGPRMGFKHAIPHIIERIYKGENPVKIYGGDQTRAFCFCTDGAEGTVLAMENGASNQQIYHIGNNDEITIDHLTRSIGSVMGYKGLYENVLDTYPGSVSRRCPDITKAKNALLYQPKVSLIEGLKKTVEWYTAFFDSGQLIDTDGFKPPEALNIK